MSDAPAPEPGAPAADTEVPAEGVATEAAAPIESPPEEYDLLDLDSLGDKYVRVKADGEEKIVPARDALQSYQQEAAWTRKSQELAEMRREAEQALQLQQAFQTNPGMTVQILANAAGVSVEEFLGMTPAQQQQAVQDGQQDEYADPLEAEIAGLRQQMQALEQSRQVEAAGRELDQVLGGLKAEFGVSDEDLIPAVQVALQQQLPPSMIPVVFRSIQFEKLRTQQQTTQEAAQARQNEDAQRQAQAAQAQAVIGSGTGATGLQGTQPDQNMSLQDAIRSGIAAGNR